MSWWFLTLLACCLLHLHTHHPNKIVNKRHVAMGDDDAMPWLHCPVIDDGTAPMPPEYCAGGHRSSSNVVVPGTDREGAMNFTFFSRPHASTAAAAASTAVPKVVTQTQHRLQPPPDATAWASSVCSGNGHHQPTAGCSVSPDEVTLNNNSAFASDRSC
jgi:hypothetical protein